MYQWKNSPEQKKGFNMEIIVIGNGGHSKVIQDMIHTKKGYKIIAILDDRYEFVSKKNNLIDAPLTFLNKIITPNTKVVIAIGDNSIRRVLSKKLIVRKDQYLTVIHPSAVVSPSAKIGYGTVVMPGAHINAEATIGDHCIINTRAIVEHENLIDDFSHISPNATLTGNVIVGEGVHIGASATIIPGINIGSWSIIGAGSTVIKHIPSYSTAVGSPTRIVRKEGTENL